MESASTMMVVPAATVLTLVASVAALAAGGLAARLAVARALLLSVKIAASSAPTPAAVIGAFLIRRAFTAVLLLRFGFWRLGWGSSK